MGEFYNERVRRKPKTLSVRPERVEGRQFLRIAGLVKVAALRLLLLVPRSRAQGERTPLCTLHFALCTPNRVQSPP